MTDGNVQPSLLSQNLEQEFVITDVFKAIKPRIPCKRPRDFTLSSVTSPTFSDPKLWNENYSSPIPRVPLADLHPNPRNGIYSTPISRPPFADPCPNPSSTSSLNCSLSPCTSKSSISSPRVLDEEFEFDEAILKEIDEICEQRSSVKREKPPDDGKALEPSSSRQIEEIANAAEVDVSLPEGYSKYMESLNEKQKEAACSDTSFPLMIIAGPGSGKTSTMVGRVLNLLKEGILPGNILAMTFTTAAASEMRERVAKVAGKAVAKELAVSTFHSFCLQLCRTHAEKLNRTSEFLIYGHGQQRRAVIESLRLLNEETRDTAEDLHNEGRNAVAFKEMSKKWQKFVTQAKASGKTPEDFQKTGNDDGAKILQNYENIKASCNALDYHDFISCSVKLLTEFPEVYKSCQDQWKAIVVDEFQDTSSMQYRLLQILGSHNHVTVIGDEDQSIFSFNGADICGFDLFRRDFSRFKEVRLCKNYRSTRCIVEAASALIRNNAKRCQQKQVVTENASGCKIVVKECYTEEAQCAFVTDRILEMASDRIDSKYSFNGFAVLYRRQVTGRLFQSTFRERKIPFNNHGVAFYRKKVVKAIIAILKTTLPECRDGPFRQAFKALLQCEKEVKKKLVQYIDKISSARNCSFLSAASDILSAKVSGTFKSKGEHHDLKNLFRVDGAIKEEAPLNYLRGQLILGRKVLSYLDLLSKLVCQESSISSVISSAANLLPQRYLLEERAVIDVDNGKYLNEDNDLRSILQYLLDDVAEFHFLFSDSNKFKKDGVEVNGCRHTLSAFLDHISLREGEHFRALRSENQNSVTLTTIHQSKGLEWDTVFIAKVNESEIPLSNEQSRSNGESGTSVEEERRLMYVAMTRARKKLYILHILMDSNRMLLHPSRFLREIPAHLTAAQEESFEETVVSIGHSKCLPLIDMAGNPSTSLQHPEEINDNVEEFVDNNNFLKRFIVEERPIVSQIFHQWARKPAFQVPKRLIDKVGFVIDERLRTKTSKNKDLLRSLKALLNDEEAIQYAQYVLRWEKIPADKRAHLMREKQEHVQKQRIEASMSSSAPSAKQVSYLQSLGCTIVPTSRLHASHLIEQYKRL